MNSKSTVSNMLWRFAERCGAQGVSFIVSIILARLLGPEAYGTIALITVFTAILQIFVDSGMGTALVQKKNADKIDFSSVFFFNIAMCSAIYAILFFGAPLISKFYENPELTPVIRVLGLTLVISGVKNIQQSYISKNLLFKKFFFATIGSTIASAIVGITLAYNGFGVWALVFQSLTEQVVSTIILWLTVHWRPSFVFSFNRMKGLFSFGWKLLVSSLIDKVYNELRQLIIGKKYSSSDLAFYNKGQQLPSLLTTNINSSIDSVLLPKMSDVQDDKSSVKAMTRRAIKTSSYIMWALMMGFSACAEPLIRLVLTESWMECVPYLRIFCFTYAFYPIHTANLNAIKAMGRSDMFLKLEIIKKIIGLIAISISMWFGVFWMAATLPLTTIISSFVNAFPNKKLMNYSYFEQIVDILPSVILSFVMFVAVFSISLIGFNDVVTLLIQVPLGIIIYVLGSYIFKLESFNYILNMIKGLLHRSNKQKV